MPGAEHVELWWLTFKLNECSLNSGLGFKWKYTAAKCSRLKNTVTYRGFCSRWKFISVPKSQHSTVKCNQPFSKHMSGVYTQRCPTQDSFYRTSSGPLPTRTHILAVRKSPNTGARTASIFRAKTLILAIRKLTNTRASLTISQY
jgi:hypothetical protein